MQTTLLASTICSLIFISCFSCREAKKAIPVCTQEKGELSNFPFFLQTCIEHLLMPDTSLLTWAIAVNQSPHPPEAYILNANSTVYE